MKAREAAETAMKTLFLCCGAVSVAAVGLITAYMVISGLPAIREIGITEFLFGQVWKSTAKEPLSASSPLSSPRSSVRWARSSSGCRWG